MTYISIREWGHHLPRRIVNLLVAISLLIVFSFPMLVISVIIFLGSPRSPIVFKQRRVGMDRRRFAKPVQGRLDSRKVNLGGRPFTMYKFRTMTHDPDRNVAWAGSHLSHVTSIGKFLRAHRLDELPQLFNVLKGDMNIVGPRPEQPELVLELQKKITGYNVRHFVLPGITGLAQVSLGYDETVDDVVKKIHTDLEYVEKASVWTDMYVMATTPLVMILRKGSK